jgi:hypothetical protein
MTACNPLVASEGDSLGDPTWRPDLELDDKADWHPPIMNIETRLPNPSGNLQEAARDSVSRIGWSDPSEKDVTTEQRDVAEATGSAHR